ncbi:MAG TPA: hypothetical protein DCW31_02180 [Lactobacillus sp.]|nr:hypothetical protein [Lactobacillus sp.]
MVILLLIVSTIGLFLAAVLMNGRLRHWLIGLFLVMFVGMIGLLIANDNYHYGMVKAHRTNTVTLVTSAPVKTARALNVLLYQPLGNGSEKVYLYRTNTSQTKPQAVPTKNAGTTLTQNARVKNATLTVKTTRWQFRNSWQHVLFAFAGEQNTVAHRHYQFRLPQSWLALSTTQAKRLANIMKSPARQRAIKANVAKQMMQALKTRPNLSATKKAQLEQAATLKAIQAQLK